MNSTESKMSVWELMLHMPAEVADEKDVEGCVELIAQFLANYNA